MTVIPRVPFSRSGGSPRTAPPGLRPALGAGTGQRPACLARLHVAGGADPSALAGAAGSFAAPTGTAPPRGSARPRQRPASARVCQRPGGGEERADGRVDAAACAAGRRGGLAAAGGYRLAVGDAERARQREPPRSGALPGRPRAAAGQLPSLRAPARDGAPAGVPGPGCSARAADRPSGRECHHPCNGRRRDHGPGCRAPPAAHRGVGFGRRRVRGGGKVAAPHQPQATAVYARSDIAAQLPSQRYRYGFAGSRVGSWPSADAVAKAYVLDHRHVIDPSEDVSQPGHQRSSGS